MYKSLIAYSSGELGIYYWEPNQADWAYLSRKSQDDRFLKRNTLSDLKKNTLLSNFKVVGEPLQALLE